MGNFNLYIYLHYTKDAVTTWFVAYCSSTQTVTPSRAHRMHKHTPLLVTKHSRLQHSLANHEFPHYVPSRQGPPASSLDELFFNMRRCTHGRHLLPMLKAVTQYNRSITAKATHALDTYQCNHHGHSMHWTPVCTTVTGTPCKVP